MNSSVDDKTLPAPVQGHRGSTISETKISSSTKMIKAAVEVLKQGVEDPPGATAATKRPGTTGNGLTRTPSQNTIDRASDRAGLVISVCVLQGEGLAACNFNIFGQRSNNSDPYVIVSLLCKGQEILVGQTKHHPGTLNPKWNATLTKTIPPGTLKSSTYTLQLKLMNYDGNDSSMGTVTIPMNVDSISKESEWYNIPPESGPFAQGRIQLALETKRQYSIDSFLANHQGRRSTQATVEKGDETAASVTARHSMINEDAAAVGTFLAAAGLDRHRKICSRGNSLGSNTERPLPRRTGRNPVGPPLRKTRSIPEELLLPRKTSGNPEGSLPRRTCSNQEGRIIPRRRPRHRRRSATVTQAKSPSTKPDESERKSFHSRSTHRRRGASTGAQTRFPSTSERKSRHSQSNLPRADSSRSRHRSHSARPASRFPSTSERKSRHSQSNLPRADSSSSRRRSHSARPAFDLRKTSSGRLKETRRREKHSSKDAKEQSNCISKSGHEPRPSQTTEVDNIFTTSNSKTPQDAENTRGEKKKSISSTSCSIPSTPPVNEIFTYSKSKTLQDSENTKGEKKKRISSKSCRIPSRPPVNEIFTYSKSKTPQDSRNTKGEKKKRISSKTCRIPSRPPVNEIFTYSKSKTPQDSRNTKGEKNNRISSKSCRIPSTPPVNEIFTYSNSKTPQDSEKTKGEKKKRISSKSCRIPSTPPVNEITANSNFSDSCQDSENTSGKKNKRISSKPRRNPSTRSLDDTTVVTAKDRTHIHSKLGRSWSHMNRSSPCLHYSEKESGASVVEGSSGRKLDGSTRNRETARSRRMSQRRASRSSKKKEGRSKQPSRRHSRDLIPELKAFDDKQE